MIKTGIYNLDQLQADKTFKGLFGLDKRISVTLYDQISNLPNADMLAERILLMFTDERGAYKRTYANRFEKFDNSVVDILEKLYSAQDSIVIQDVAISDGRTAVDLFLKVATALPNLKYLASDYNPKIFVIEKNRTKLTLSHNHKLIEVVWPPFVFNSVLPDRYWHEPLNRLIQFFVEKIIIIPMLKLYAEGKLQSREIYLFAPATLSLAKKDERFKLSAHNILTPFATKSHVIRAMNILNPTYFSRVEFRQVILNLYDGLYENGLLIAGSNQDSGSIVDGGIYMKKGPTFVNILRSGKGLYVEDMLTQLLIK